MEKQIITYHVIDITCKKINIKLKKISKPKKQLYTDVLLTYQQYHDFDNCKGKYETNSYSNHDLRGSDVLLAGKPEKVLVVLVRY